MKAVLSWIKDYVNLEGLSLEEIASKLTMLGLEVEGIKVVGLPLPAEDNNSAMKVWLGTQRR
jgi:phenylalanyl-tRNA synthetase beta chain